MSNKPKAEHKHVVRAVEPEAYALGDNKQNKVQIVLPPSLIGITSRTIIGVGGTVADAWADAAANVSRPPVPQLPPSGSATWSLQTDETYWKDKPHAQQT